MSIHLKELVKGAGIALVLKVVGGAFMLVFGVAVTRSLGAKDSGIFFLALTIITIISIVGRFGLDNVIVKVTSNYSILNQWSALHVFYRKTIIIGIILSISFSLLLWILAPALANNVFNEDELAPILQILAFAITPLVVLNMHGQFLRGLKRISHSEIVLSFGMPAITLFISFVALAWGIYGFAIAYVISAATILILSILLWLYELPKDTSPTTQGQTQKEIFRSAAPFFVATIMGMIIDRTSIIILGLTGTSSEVAIFEAANRTTLVINFMLAAINSIAAPKFAALYMQHDMKNLKSTVRHGARILTMAATPFLAILVLIPEKVMSIYGLDFVDGSTALMILAIGQFFNAATGSVGYLLMMTNNEKLLRNIVVVSALMHIIICIYAIPKYGVIGAAVATAITMSLVNFVSTFFSWKKLNILSIGFR